MSKYFKVGNKYKVNDMGSEHRGEVGVLYFINEGVTCPYYLGFEGGRTQVFIADNLDRYYEDDGDVGGEVVKEVSVLDTQIQEVGEIIESLNSFPEVLVQATGVGKNRSVEHNIMIKGGEDEQV